MKTLSITAAMLRKLLLWTGYGIGLVIVGLIAYPPFGIYLERLGA